MRRSGGRSPKRAFEAPGSGLSTPIRHHSSRSATLSIATGAPAAAGFSTEDMERLRAAAQSEARNVIDTALRRAGDQAIGGLEVERQAVEGPTVQVLIESARGAELLVLGSRGRGGFLGLLLGSVSQQCAQHPPCPVVILPPPDEDEALRE